MPQKHKAMVQDCALHMEMNVLEEQADNAKARDLRWKPLSCHGTLRPTTGNDAWDQPGWETFVCTTLGLQVPVLASRVPPSPASTDSRPPCEDARSTVWTSTSTTR
jgi:hypothetical protein